MWERALNCILSPFCCSLSSFVYFSPESWQPVEQTGTLAKCFTRCRGLGSGDLWEQIVGQSRELVPHYCVIPFMCRALARPPSHIPLFWRTLAVCPAIGHCVRGRPSTKAAEQGGGGTRTRRKGLTFRGKLSRFVYRATSFRKGDEQKNTGNSRAEGRGGVLFHLCAGPTGVFVKVFRLVREVGQCLTGCSVGVLSLLVRRAWSLLLNAITPLGAVCTSEGLDLQSTSPHLFFFHPCLLSILYFLPSFSCCCLIHTSHLVFSSNILDKLWKTCLPHVSPGFVRGLSG